MVGSWDQRRVTGDVGKAGVAKLAQSGFRVIGDLAKAEIATLYRLVGKDGPRLRNLALGIDPRKVTVEHEAKTVSSETTLDVDLARFEELEPILWRLCERPSQRLKAQELAGRTVTLKLKTHDFHIITRAARLPEPSQLAARLFSAGRDLLKRECTGPRYRLIGIGMSDFSDPAEADRGDLADQQTPRLKAMESAYTAASIARARKAFAEAADEAGILLSEPPKSVTREGFKSPDLSRREGKMKRDG